MWSNLRRWALLDPPHSLISELKPWGPEWRKAAWFWGILILLLVTGHQLARVWVFEYVGLWSADKLASLRAPEGATETSVVIITDDERRTLLSGNSPIPARNLRQAVCAILLEKPKVLGVDLDTSQVALTPPRTSTKVVWARGIKITRQHDASGKAELKVGPDYLLGKADPDVLSGLAVAPVMPDWSVRSIPTCYEYDRGRVMPTMIAALANAAAGRPIPDCEGKEGDREVGAYAVNYQFDRFTLADFSPQRLDDRAIERCQRGEGEWSDAAASNHPLKGRVVLLGGEYDAQDWHQTPYGLQPGVEVLAGLTEHVLRGSSAYAIEDWMEWAFKIVLALMIAWIHSRCRPVAALLLSLMGLGALILTGGLLAVFFTAYRATVVPFLLGIILEQLVTSANKAQKGGEHITTRIAAPAGARITGSEIP
jgi:hypothetical protein